MGRLVWRKHRREPWLDWTPNVSDLLLDGVRVGGAALIDHAGFAWSTPENVTLGISFHNSYQEVIPTMAEAKAACLAFVRACLAAKATLSTR